MPVFAGDEAATGLLNQPSTNRPCGHFRRTLCVWGVFLFVGGPFITEFFAGRAGDESALLPHCTFQPLSLAENLLLLLSRALAC
jgi:hypothetical protein